MKTLWDGSTKENLGGKETIRHAGIIVNRDHNGSRNIFIRFFTKLIGQALLTKGSLHLNHNQDLVVLAV